MKNLYTLQPPYGIRDELMNAPEFFIPNTASGTKTAAYMESASNTERKRLFKLAAKDGDLDKAYKKLTALQVNADDSFDYDASDDDDTSDDVRGLAEDSSEVEDNEFKIEDEDDDSEE